MKKLFVLASFVVSINAIAQGSPITLQADWQCEKPLISGHFNVTINRVTTGDDPHRATLGKALDEAIRQLPSFTPGPSGGCIITKIQDFQ